MITMYEDFCILCNRPSQETHHLIPGRANRAKSERYGLTAPLCRDCHYKVHSSSGTELNRALHIAGQLQFEKERIIQGMDADEARELFRKEFGKSWL